MFMKKLGLFLGALLCAGVSFAKSSDFVIALSNSTSLTQPLYYMVAMRKGDQLPVQGLLIKNAKSTQVMISAQTPDESRAYVFVKDSTGHVLWESDISYNTISEFYTNTISLDPNYRLNTTVFPAIKGIAFDLRDQATA